MGARPVDLTRAFDVKLALAAARGQQIKGLFISDYAAELERRNSPWPHRFVAFKEYPMEEFVEIVNTLARLRAPTAPLREAWHELSTTQYPVLRDSRSAK